MIKHFDIWPMGVDKNNLFDEQKIFLIYLMGIIPSKEDWSLQIDYKKKLAEIENIKDIKLSKTDLDLAKLQGKNLEKLKSERLKSYKRERLKELNNKFGVKEDNTENEIEQKEQNIENKKNNQRQELWDLLQGKVNGLQDKV
jgi:hypothetical protein